MQYLLHGTGIFLSPVAEYTYFLHSDQYPSKSVLPSSPPVSSTTQHIPPESSSTENPASESSSPKPDVGNPTSLETAPTSTLPDLEFAWVAAWGTAEDAVPSLSDKKGFNTLLVQCTRPESKGSITVTSLDARVPPLVDPKYLSSPQDMETMRKGVLYGLDLGRKMMEKYPMQEALVPDRQGAGPGEDSTQGSEINTDSIDDFIRDKLSGAYHLSSTCRMAPRNDSGVVNQELKVYGVQGLRVADASVFPRLVGMKPQATIVMVGEKCAELLVLEGGGK
jgi:choline dehydrogenase-like flavoprotein